MIYLPHPNFNFQASEGGYVFGCVNYDEQKHQHLGCIPFNFLHLQNLNPDKIKEKFETAKSYYWNMSTSICFAFLREDGEEFAIRFIKNDQIDVIGHWITTLRSTQEWTDSPVGYAQRGPSEIPASFYEFLNWLESAIA